MKKLFFALTFSIFIIQFVKAQEENSLKDTWWATGSFGLYSNSSENSEQKGFHIMPIVGKFVTDDFTIGLGIGFYNSNSQYLTNNDEFKNIGFSVQPLIRKYWNLSDNVYFFGQTSLPLSFYEIDYTNSNIKNTGFNVGLNFSPGIDIRINQKISFETYYDLVGISYSTLKNNQNKKSDSFNFSGQSTTSLNNLTIGLKYLF